MSSADAPSARSANGVADKGAAASTLGAAKFTPASGMEEDAGDHGTIGTNDAASSVDSSSEPSTSNHVERLLQRVPLFENVPQSHLHSYAQVCEQLELPADHDILKQGDVGDTLFVIVQGSASVFVRDKGEVATSGADESRCARHRRTPPPHRHRRTQPGDIHRRAAPWRPRPAEDGGSAERRTSARAASLSRAVASTSQRSGRATILA